MDESSRRRRQNILSKKRDSLYEELEGCTDEAARFRTWPRRNEIQLSPDDRQAHAHVIGSSGSGKSKFLEWMMRQDLRGSQGFCLIDPHGTLYHDILSYCGHKVLERDIVLLDLSNPANITGFNPFKKAPEGIQTDSTEIQVTGRRGDNNTCPGNSPEQFRFPVTYRDKNTIFDHLLRKTSPSATRYINAQRRGI
jgi:hypothetical protein